MKNDIKGKTENSLRQSEKKKFNFLFKIGVKKVPHSILRYNRNEKAMDVIATNKACNFNLYNKLKMDKLEFIRILLQPIQAQFLVSTFRYE